MLFLLIIASVLTFSLRLLKIETLSFLARPLKIKTLYLRKFPFYLSYFTNFALKLVLFQKLLFFGDGGSYNCAGHSTNIDCLHTFGVGMMIAVHLKYYLVRMHLNFD